MKVFFTLAVLALTPVSSAFAWTCLCSGSAPSCDASNCTIFDPSVYHVCRVSGGIHDPWGLCNNSISGTGSGSGGITEVTGVKKVKTARDTIYLSPAIKIAPAKR